MKTLFETMKQLETKGYSLDTKFKNGTMYINAKPALPQDFTIDNVYRFEGMSNPADLSILYSVHNRQGEKAVIVNAFGSKNNLQLNEFIKKIPDARS